jgi:hypothetical protein
LLVVSQYFCLSLAIFLNIRDVIRGKTKPHAFTWIVWTVITVIVGITQIAAGAGRGAVHNIVTGFISLIILYFALKNKQKDIKRVDIYLFIAALASLPLWAVTDNPTYSVLLITIIDIFAFIPTVRKTWHDPASETLISYALAGIKYCIALIAIASYSLGTVIYPIALITMNIIMCSIMILKNPNHKATTPDPDPAIS